jgi:hypothetical protein
MLAKTETAKQISGNKLRKLIKAKNGAKKQTREINGSVGGQISDAVENENLDKVAFSMASRLEAMSPEKLWTTLPALLYYIDELGLEEKAKSAPPLPVDEEDDGKSGKLKPFPKPGSVSSE